MSDDGTEQMKVKVADLLAAPSKGQTPEIELFSLFHHLKFYSKSVTMVTVCVYPFTSRCDLHSVFLNS